MRRQAERWGAELYQEDVEAIDVKSSPFTVQSSERKVIYSLADLQFHDCVGILIFPKLQGYIFYFNCFFQFTR